MIIIFTGNGKGKTSAAIGTVLRAIYRKKKVVIVQFLKTSSSGEIRLLKDLTIQPLVPRSFSEEGSNHLTIYSFGKKTFTNPKKLTEKDQQIINKSLQITNKVIASKPFLLIMDEILIALKFKLISEKQILEIIDDCKKKDIHLILTGRGATKKLIEAADLVTEMKKIKHPFDKGIEAIEGVDF
jgi:cob(I)alamin adenosyltransferase